jgi:hypothetical protein
MLMRIILILITAFFPLFSHSVFAINAKTNTTPALAFYEGKLHIVFAGHNNPFLWNAVYDPSTRRWSSLGRIHDENVRRSWAFSYHPPVAFNVTERGTFIDERLQLVFKGHNNNFLWKAEKNDGANPAFDPWSTPGIIPAETNKPVAATMHRWRRLVTPRLTVGYVRSNRAYYKVLDRGWSEEFLIPTGTVDGGGVGLTLLSSEHDEVRSDLRSLYAFYVGRGLDTPNRYVWYTRKWSGSEWESARAMLTEAPPVAEATQEPVATNADGSRHWESIKPGPIAAVNHPWGIILSYKSNADHDNNIWVGFSIDGSEWIDLGYVQNINYSLVSPALAFKDGLVYMAYLPRYASATHGLSRPERDRVYSEVCVGILNLMASGGPSFQSIRHDLPTSYCESD